MTGVSHAVIGTALTLSLVSKLTANNSELLIATTIGAFAATLPDIDAENSVLQVFVNKNRPVFVNYLIFKRERTTIVGGLIYSILSSLELLVRAAFVAIFSAVKLFNRHRGFTHQITGVLVISTVFLTINFILNQPLIYTVAFIIGYLTHIMADMMTVSGLSFLTPLMKKKMYLIPASVRIRSSKLSATEVLFVFYFLVMSLLIYLV